MSAFGDSVALTYSKLEPDGEWQYVYAVKCGGNATNVVVKSRYVPGRGKTWRGYVNGELVTGDVSTRWGAADVAMRKAGSK